MRFIVLLVGYVLCLGLVSINITFVDGFKVNLVGWPEMLTRINSKKEKELALLYKFKDMCVSSLCPETYDKFEEVMIELSKARNLNVDLSK